eukprot:1067458-Pleurochrysis_carterae.AAC.1
MLVVVAVVCAEALALTHAAPNPNSLLFRNTAGVRGFEQSLLVHSCCELSRRISYLAHDTSQRHTFDIYCAAPL